MREIGECLWEPGWRRMRRLILLGLLIGSLLVLGAAAAQAYTVTLSPESASVGRIVFRLDPQPRGRFTAWLGADPHGPIVKARQEMDGAAHDGSGRYTWNGLFPAGDWRLCAFAPLQPPASPGGPWEPEWQAECKPVSIARPILSARSFVSLRLSRKRVVIPVKGELVGHWARISVTLKRSTRVGGRSKARRRVSKRGVKLGPRTVLRPTRDRRERIVKVILTVDGFNTPYAHYVPVRLVTRRR